MIGDLVSEPEGKGAPPAPGAESIDRIFAPVSDASKKRWLLLCLLVSLLYSTLGLLQAFGSEFVVQDDARHHVIWMQSFNDPELFSGDLIAEYFKSLAGTTFSSIYWLAAQVGIDAIFLSKILPVVLSLIASAFCYLLCLRLIPVPVAATLCTVMFLQGLWMEDDIQSACARALYYPLFLPFLYYLGKRKLLPVVITLALQGAYPSLLILSEAILVSTLVTFKGGRLKISSSIADYKFVGAGIVAGGIGMLPMFFSTSAFGATITGAEAVKMPEFHPGGREQYYTRDLLRFWVTGLRSGVFPMDHPPPILCWVGLLLPLMMIRPLWFPLSRRVNLETLVLFARVAVVGVALYLIARMVEFQLYIPNRYSSYGLRMLLCFAAGLVIALAAERVFKNARPKFAILAPLALCLIVLSPLLVPDFPRSGYVTGCYGDLYKYLAKQPKNILVASLVEEGANIPAFARRSILASREYGIAFKKGYYDQFRQRVKDTVAAQYSPSLDDVRKFNQKYNVTYWLLESDSFKRDYMAKQGHWLFCFQPEEHNARQYLNSGGPIALEKASKECAVLETGGLTLLSAEKINQMPDGDIGR